MKLFRIGLLAVVAASLSLFFVALSAAPLSAQELTPAEIAKFSAEKSLGSPDAPIKMEVFDDYECPACGRFYEETLKPMIADYVASGKVYLIHHDFPLPGHQYSRLAARWVNAAARIGKFEAVERSLFDNQMAWSEFGSGSMKGNVEPFVRAALTPTEFKKVQHLMEGCQGDSHDELKGCAVDAVIQHDLDLGQAVPVMQTPTIVITCRGQKYPPIGSVIAWPLLKQFMDQLLAQK